MFSEMLSALHLHGRITIGQARGECFPQGYLSHDFGKFYIRSTSAVATDCDRNHQVQGRASEDCMRLGTE